MKVKQSLERAKQFKLIVDSLKQGDKVVLTPEDLEFFEKAKENEDILIRRYPVMVATRHKSRRRKSGEGRTDYWRERTEMFTEALLEQVNDYLESN